MKSSPRLCATSWSPTTSPTCGSKRDWTISMPSASVSKPSPIALPASRRNGSMSTSTFRCCSASPCRSPSGAVRYPGIKIHDSRVIRLLEVLLHGGSHVGGWTAKQIHHAVLTTFDLSDTAFRHSLPPKSAPLRPAQAQKPAPAKAGGHRLLQRDGSRYAYRLTPKGVQVALLFLFFHKRLRGPPPHN